MDGMNPGQDCDYGSQGRERPSGEAGSVLASMSDSSRLCPEGLVPEPGADGRGTVAWEVRAHGSHRARVGSGL